MNKARGDCRSLGGVKGRGVSGKQTGIVLSAENQKSCAWLACRPPSPSLKLVAPVGKEWRDASRTGRGCSGCGYRPRYAGIQAGKYAGEITCLLGAGCRPRGRVSDRPASNSMWPGFHPSCGRLKSEPVMHICGLFYCCSVLPRYVQRATNKAQFHLVPIYPSPCSASPVSLSPHRAQNHLDVARERSKVQILYWCGIPV